MVVDKTDKQLRYYIQIGIFSLFFVKCGLLSKLDVCLSMHHLISLGCWWFVVRSRALHTICSNNTSIVSSP